MFALNPQTGYPRDPCYSSSIDYGCGNDDNPYPYPSHIITLNLEEDYLPIALPLFHHLFLVPPTIRYISTAANFFAFRGEVQLLCLGVMSVCAFGLAYLQRRLIST